MIRSTLSTPRTTFRGQRPFLTTILLPSAIALSGCATPATTPKPKTAAQADSQSPSAPDQVNGWQSSHGRPESEAITAEFVAAPASSTPIVLGYFTNWAHYRPAPCDFQTSDVPVNLLTHINYSFALVGVRDSSGKAIQSKEELAKSPDAAFELIPSDPNDEDRLYSEVIGLKKTKPNLDVMLSVGGWAFNDEPTAWVFSALAESPERRGHFIRQSIKYLRKYGFDGLDLDWEFPGVSERGGREVDSENFTALLRELRAAFAQEAKDSGQTELLLTIAAPAGHYYAQHQQLGKIHEALNWINVMTYDYHGNWDKKTGANAPLGGGEPDIPSTIAMYKAAGVPADKIVLGFATYARGWGGVEEAKPGADGPEPGPSGACGKDSLKASEVEDWVNKGVYTSSWDEGSQTPFAYDAEKKFYVSYENQRSVDAKLDYLEAEGLRGGMFWAIDLDDTKKGYPLIRQVSERVLAKEDLSK
ncbi:MAG: glycoside hydrolase family 18 protein [Polyangiaceae bacterium]|nr:glycoside hydrolase family 18 protein [Polyangiaceae bacterium]